MHRLRASPPYHFRADLSGQRCQSDGHWANNNPHSLRLRRSLAHQNEVRNRLGRLYRRLPVNGHTKNAGEWSRVTVAEGRERNVSACDRTVSIL